MNDRLTFKRRIARFAPVYLRKLGELRAWCDFVRSSNCPLFDRREQLYGYVQAQLGCVIDYLEFGVADGESLRSWVGLNDKRESRFWGFDSFEGLPEDWRTDRPKGMFNRGGQPPCIPDPRLAFQVGWFQDTLPSFLEAFAPEHQLVIHNDSDLYSSTLYVLTKMDPYLGNAVILFDEFYDSSHEFRALQDYLSAYNRRVTLIAATKHFNQAALRIHVRTALKLVKRQDGDARVNSES